jgi:hypothetical protein
LQTRKSNEREQFFKPINIQLSEEELVILGCEKLERMGEIPNGRRDGAE